MSDNTLSENNQYYGQKPNDSLANESYNSDHARRKKMNRSPYEQSQQTSAEELGVELRNQREEAADHFEDAQSLSPMEKWLTRRGEHKLLKKHREQSIAQESEYRRHVRHIWYEARIKVFDEKANAMIKQASAHIRADLVQVAKHIRMEMERLMIDTWIDFINEHDRLLNRISRISRPGRREMILRRADEIENQFMDWSKQLLTQLENSIEQRVSDFERQ